MYTTRSLNLYKNSKEAISELPEGPNSGFLVIQDDKTGPKHCFGLIKDNNLVVNSLPFPQNKVISFEYYVMTSAFPYSGYATKNDVYLIPVVNQPLSHNTYYVINALDGNHIGESYASSKKEDKSSIFCFNCPYIDDVNPRPLEPEDLYQQFKFSLQTRANSEILVAKSMAFDGKPPEFLSKQGLRAHIKTPKNFTLGEALGIDKTLRSNRLNFSLFSLSQTSSEPVIVGKWYCPFMFIKEGSEKDRMQNSMFYEMTLEQRWDRIWMTQREGNVAKVDIVVPTESVRIGGCKGVYKQEGKDGNRVVWFESEKREKLGLSSLIFERMKWEEERVGWIGNAKKEVRVVKKEDYKGVGDWKRIGWYVLVESFVLKRFDGNVRLTYDFLHTHVIRSKWE